MRRNLFAAAALALLIAGSGAQPAALRRLAGFPKIMLWAWERPEDLNFVDPRQCGVAFLARTLALRGEQVVLSPRLQPLKVPPGTALMAVARIEPDRSRPPDLSPAQRAQAVSAIAELAALPGIAAIQVDFDALASQRAFYRGLLFDLRRRLPESTPLSITALASWCMDDNWLTDLPVDEAVPMLFRLGPDRRWVLLHLAGGGDFQSALCRQSLGISTDEPLPKLPSGRRIYVFHPRAWTSASEASIHEELQKRQ